MGVRNSLTSFTPAAKFSNSMITVDNRNALLLRTFYMLNLMSCKDQAF